MNKKIAMIVIIILICIISISIFFLLNNKENKKEQNNPNQNETSNNDNQENDIQNESNDTTTNNKKVLVVYFSATNSTKNVAEKIARNLNGDLFEIEPINKYTSDDLNWTNNNSRVSREHENDSLRNIELKNTKVDNWDSYDTILIGYPIWWGIAAWPINNFVKDNNFTGKTVIPFCTSASSGLGNSGKLLEDISNGGKWLHGHRFSSSASDSDIKEWTDTL